jgi:AraC-like DNA-binding protein
MEKQAYTVAEVAALIGLSRNTVTRMFERERGVIILKRPERMHKRRYRSIRIPRAVFERGRGGSGCPALSIS